jgi:hypothetical protein
MTATDRRTSQAGPATCREAAPPLPGRDGVPPSRDEIAAIVLKAWSEVLGLTVVHPDTSFFDAGGTSIQALQIVRKIRRALPVQLPVSLFLQAGTPACLASVIAASMADG